MSIYKNKNTNLLKYAQNSYDLSILFALMMLRVQKYQSIELETYSHVTFSLIFMGCSKSLSIWTS